MIDRHERPGFLVLLRENQRLFRRVTVGLVLLWLVSVICYQESRLWIYEVCIGAGAVTFATSENFSRAKSFECEAPHFIWEREARAQIGGAENLTLLLAGNGFWKWGDHYHSSIPIGGLLGAWLALGCMAEFMARKNPAETGEGAPRGAPYSRRRLVIPACGAALLAVGIPWLTMRAKEQTFKAACMLNHRNIQQVVRSYSGIKGLPIGSPIVWGDIIGSGKFLSPRYGMCPWGEPYELSEGIPGVGVLAARCRHSGHEKVMEGTDTSDW